MSLGTVQDPREVARYIEGLANELKALATSAGLGFTAYLLGMVVEDAAATARRLDREARQKGPRGSDGAGR
jgi:hypothetical protein